MRELEVRAEALAGTFRAQDVSNMLWAYATMGRKPGAVLMRELEGRAEALVGTFNAQDVANIMWAYATMGREPEAGIMRELEGRAEALAGTFNAQDVANTLWAYAAMGREPGTILMRELEGRAEAVAGTFNPQNVANTLWAYATMARLPGEGLMRAMDGRVEALAGMFEAQHVANTLWAACVFFVLRVPEEGILSSEIDCTSSRLMHTVAQRLVALDKPECFNTAQLSQLHQFFVWCSVETRLGLEAINVMHSFKETCRLALEGQLIASSAAQKQVSETLHHMGLSVQEEIRCPTSGYSIDMLVHESALEMGGERRSGGGAWAVEFDGPAHFLASGAPNGATLLKRRHLQLLGHALVSVPYWEWDKCQGVGEREQYLKGKLAACAPAAAQGNVHGNG